MSRLHWRSSVLCREPVTWVSAGHISFPRLTRHSTPPLAVGEIQCPPRSPSGGVLRSILDLVHRRRRSRSRCTSWEGEQARAGASAAAAPWTLASRRPALAALILPRRRGSRSAAMLSALDPTDSRAHWRAGTHRVNLWSTWLHRCPSAPRRRISGRAGFVMPVIGGFAASVNFLAPAAVHPGGGAGEVF